MDVEKNKKLEYMLKYNKRFISWLVKEEFWSSKRSTISESINRIYAKIR